MIGVPTDVTFVATGALGLKVKVRVVVVVRALAGTVTLTPSRLRLPPAGPILAVTVPVSVPEDELQATKRTVTQTAQRYFPLYMVPPRG